MRKSILRKYNGLRKVILVCLYATAVIAVWVLSNNYINLYLKNQKLTYIDDLAKQKAAWISGRLVSKIELLECIADRLAESEIYNYAMSIEYVTELKDWIGIDKLAIIETTGYAYTSEGVVEDVSDELFFQIPMEGLPYFSGVLESSESESGITSYGVPIISPEGDAGTIVGVLVAFHKTEDFAQGFLPRRFQGLEDTYLIDEEGDVIEGIIHSDVAELDNVFELLSKGQVNTTAIGKLEKALSNQENVTLSYKSNGNKYAICVPLKLNNWSMMMVVPEEIIDEQINYISIRLQVMFSLIFTASIILLIYISIREYKAQSRLKKIAYINSNTGLYNKMYLRNQLDNKITGASDKNTALVIYNIQKFKVFNELYGTELGDKILVEVARVLKNSKKYKNEIVIHGYADEFATLYFYESKEELEKCITDNLENIKNDVYDKYKIIAEIAVGIYEVEDSKSPFESIYTLTCMAKNKNKEAVAEPFTYYTKELVEVELERKKLEDSIREGIKNKEFKAWFQPQFDNHTYKITGCEALARWHKSDGSVLTPYYFIEASERSTLICDIDKLIFEDVCKNIREWMDKNLLCVPVSVNLSRQHLQNLQIVEELKEIVDRYNVPTELIQLEITESVMIANEKILKQVIERLHELGFRVLLDDFGVGYSSLMAINSLNFDVLKIDKSFVDELDTKNGKFIIEYTIHLGRQLGMDIIIEGVETKEQVEYFHQMKQVSIQGYYFSKPVDHATIQKFLQDE